MKKFLLGLLLVLLLAGVGAFVFREPLKEMVYERVTSDMFVAVDNDSFDPGLSVGAQFPAIRALHEGAELTDIAQFSGPNGLVFIANRSVDW
ncbi:MAG: hypothetical protein AB8B93_08030 [Pseudomonadales bacterium]